MELFPGGRYPDWPNLATMMFERARAWGRSRVGLRCVQGEANWNVSGHDTLFARVENVENDELFPDHASPLHEVPLRVTKFQAGYARRIPLGPVELALGASGAAYAKPAALDAVYGRNPLGYTLFVKLLLGH